MHLGSSLKNNRLVLARSNVLSVFIGICGIMCRIFIGADAVGRKQNPVTCDAGVHPSVREPLINLWWVSMSQKSPTSTLEVSPTVWLVPAIIALHPANLNLLSARPDLIRGSFASLVPPPAILSFPVYSWMNRFRKFVFMDEHWLHSYKIGQVRPYIEVLLIILQGKKARGLVAQAVFWFTTYAGFITGVHRRVYR